ncbi:MAG: hypothetical protein GYA23_07400 [Methanomicrobiales archaeon]|nr:hypothetical protein [Methanomicrobiales archaeon]
MAKFCPECGKSISDSLNYCPSCGVRLDAVIRRQGGRGADAAAPVRQGPAPPARGSASPAGIPFVVYGVVIALVTILVVIAAVIFVPSVNEPVMGILTAPLDISSAVGGGPAAPPPLATATTVPVESQRTKNARMLREMVEEYHAGHTYIGDDVFDCEKMATDVWNMVVTKGINATIQIGNVKSEAATMKDADHAWVLAEIAPGDWIALETTGGYLVCADRAICSVNNTLYFRGWSYRNPREYQDALENLRHPCPAGYVYGQDMVCHEACGGSHYCSNNSVCVNGQCRGCESGYVLGDDMKCHKACESPTTYCTGNTVCVSGRCRGCDAGYILGEDLQCHQPCGTTTSYCTGDSVCINGQCRTCPSGYTMGPDYRCYLP